MRRPPLAGGAALVLLVLAGAACTDDATRDTTERDDGGEVVGAGEVGAFRLRVGDCLADDAIGEVTSLPVVPCDDAHVGEVYHAFQLDGDAFPGDDTVARLAGEACFEQFEPFVGEPYATSIYDFTTLSPTEETWDRLDDREVLCIAVLYEGGTTTGTARGVGR